MVDEPNPYAVTSAADQAINVSAEHDVPVRGLKIIGGFHALLGTWGLASSSLLLMGVYPGLGGTSGIPLTSLLPSILLAGMGIVGGVLLSRRHPAGWWLIGTLSVGILIHQFMIGYFVLGPGGPVFRGQQSATGLGVFAILRGALGLAVVGYLSQGAVQRACRVRAAGRPVNLLLMMLGGVALVLVLAAIRLV